MSIFSFVSINKAFGKRIKVVNVSSPNDLIYLYINNQFSSELALESEQARGATARANERAEVQETHLKNIPIIGRPNS